MSRKKQSAEMRRRKALVRKLVSKMNQLQRKADRLGERIFTLRQQRDGYVYEFRALEREREQLLREGE